MDIFEHLSRHHICLDPEQRAAVCHERGPLLVIAVPGSGKTTVLVSRVARADRYWRCRACEYHDADLQPRGGQRYAPAL